MIRILLAVAMGGLLAAGMGWGQSKPAQAPAKNTSGKTGSGSHASEPFAIEGRVTTSDGAGIPGATVKATSRDTATTDNGGRYSIRGLSRSHPSYVVSVSKAGYRFDPERKTVTSPSKGDSKSVNFSAVAPKK